MKKRPLFLLFNIIFIVFIVNTVQQIFVLNNNKNKLRKELQETQRKIDDENQKKAQIMHDINNFSEAEKIERVARDKLNMKKEGEVTYKVIEQ